MFSGLKEKITSWRSKKSNLVFALIFGILLLRQLPVLIHNFQQEEKFISHEMVRVYNRESLMEFPPKSSRAMVIFWASWCGPCKVEMKRLKSSVESGSIPENAIFAINPFEPESDIKKFLKGTPYPFNFVASSLGNQLSITVTPTTVFFDKGIITSMSSGMSIWGIWKAELYL